MLLKELLENINFACVSNFADLDIKNISSNSNKIQANSDTLFVAIRGLKSDGHNYIQNAIDNGAVAILVEKDIKNIDRNVVVIKVNNTRETLSKLAFRIYGNPQKDMNIVGVTGTNGKTSTTIIIESILRSVDKKCAVLGTIANRIGEKSLKTKTTTITTPDIVELAEMFNEIKKNNIKNVIMEATSHALSLNRLDQIDFNIGIFTNLTLDHLDYHKTMRNYADTKFKLFQKSKKAVINIDDDCGREFFEKITTEKMSFSTKDKNADLFAYNIRITSKGNCFDLKYKGVEYKSVFSNIVGMFSIYNVLGSIGACLFMEVDIDNILRSLKNIENINGRCEVVPCIKDTTVIVDYAHSPDGLENILKTVRELTNGKIVSVFGLGGNRERTKRAIMGELSGNLADFTIISTDNPRNENPADIVKEIESGILKTGKPYKIILDRKEAIKFAINMVEKDDVVLITGKGHEEYQEYKNGEREHFSDKETVMNFGKN